MNPKSNARIPFLSVLLLSFLMSCSDQQAAPWELSEFQFDWRLDWSIVIIGHAEDPSEFTIYDAVGDLCYWNFRDSCVTNQWKQAVERLESMDLDFSLLPRANNSNSDWVWPPVPPWLLGTRVIEECHPFACPDGIVCDDYGGCSAEEATPCSRVCERVGACYETVEQCEQKCELMFKGPCSGGKCPLSEPAILQYVIGVERLTCEEMIEWNGLSLFPHMVPQQLGWIWPRGDCTKTQQAAIIQRAAFVSLASTAEVAERITVCGEFRECAEQLQCLKQEGLIADDI